MRNFGLILFAVATIAIAQTAKAQWTKTNGPEGGFATTIFNDPTSGYIFVGGNGFYRSSDNGATWHEASNGMSGAASPVAVVRSGSKLFAASLDEVYLSTDNGDSWTLRNSGLTAQVLSMTAIGNVIVVGTNVYGVFRTTDDGGSWTAATGFPPSNNIVQTIVAYGSRLLAGLGGKKIWTSVDSGKTWSQYGAGTGFGASHTIGSLAVHGTKIFGACSDSAIFVTTDGGANWAQSASGMNPRALASRVVSNGTTLFAQVSGAYTGTDTGVVYRSTDNGGTWASVKANLHSTYGSSLGFGTGKVFFATYSGVEASTDNGVTWSLSNTGLANANALCLTPWGSTLFAGFSGGIAMTQDGGATWTLANNGVPQNNVVVAMTTHDSYIFASSNGVLRSSDNGASWVSMSNGLSGFALYVSALAAGGSYVYSGSTFGGIYVSSDNGANWTGPGTGLPSFGAVTSIFVDGSTTWATISSNGIFRSTDNGATWSDASTGLPPFGRDVSSVVRIGSNLYAGLLNGSGSAAYVSTDNGGNWTSSGTGIPSGSYLSTLYAVGQDLFAGFNYNGPGVASGIYRSSDYGANWSPVNTGLPNPCSINKIAVVGSTMYGSYLGVWKRPLSEVTAVEEVQGIVPSAFSLEQNFPNPFNPKTVISYSLSVNGFVTLKVFDALGCEVATIVNQEFHPGTYHVSWDASNQPSGTYFYRLKSGAYTESRRMLLVK